MSRFAVIGKNGFSGARLDAVALAGTSVVSIAAGANALRGGEDGMTENQKRLNQAAVVLGAVALGYVIADRGYAIYRGY